MSKSNPNLLVVLGPTASGKTTLGVRLADELGGEIISADSRQVYRGLDIGAGKDLDQYQLDGRSIAYHLIDVADLDCEFSLFDYQQMFYRVQAEIRARGALPMMVGGSGLYIESVLLAYELVEVPKDPALRAELAGLSDSELEKRLRSIQGRLHNVTDLASRERTLRAIEIAVHSKNATPPPPPDLRPLVLGTRFERPVLRRRIELRLEQRLEQGMLEEVEHLHAAGVSWERLDSLGLEYRHLARFIRGEISSRDELFAGLASAIYKFAMRQLAWFRRMQRKGVEIHWIDGADHDQALSVARDLWLSHKNS